MDHDGRIREYPAIAIDRFTLQTGVKYYFLTHAHSDHTQGLEDKSFKNTIYCSKLTAKLLIQKKVRKKLYFGHLKNQFMTHDFFEPFIIDTREYGLLTITFIPSNHCPGAIMIMIEGKNGTILHTGDTRLERDFVNKYLKDLEYKKIQHVYLDTTFCTDQHREFITKNQSVQLLCELIDSFPGNYHFYLDFWMYGYEQAWWHIAQKYSTQIHVSKERYQLYCHLNPDMFQSILTIDESSTRFHSCQWEKNSFCIQHENYTISVQGAPIVGNSIRPFTKNDYKLRSDLPKHAKVHQEMIFPFSMHSSLLELVDFIKLLQPKRVTPIVAHGRKWDTTAYMLTLLRSYGVRFGLDRMSSSSSSSSSIFSMEKQENDEIKNNSFQSNGSYSTTTTTDENSIPNTTSHSHSNQIHAFKSSLNEPTQRNQHPIPCDNENTSFLEILSGPSEASIGSLTEIESLSKEEEEEETLTKFDRAATNFRASILNRKRPHASSVETLSWDGSYNFDKYSSIEETEQHDFKRTLNDTTSSSSFECKMSTTSITIHNHRSSSRPNIIKSFNTKVKIEQKKFGTTIENPICID
ncbi:hypothetical protein INT45_013000 [Circinella minor]|uniref:Protein artemis n=1 Tax=Circinella minor TaxID=1195481 RepID=A0A8H7RT45_9FUNG|nr:hypothetical protein INT45_013000 [Circinella minor]